jgi:hypothetical protein
MIMIDHGKVPEYAQVLSNLDKPITERVTSLFCLRTVGNLDAINGLINAFDVEPKSDLLKHEICYCLG